MKKIISFILVAILCLGALTSCAALDGIVDKITGLIGGEQGGETDDGLEGAKNYVFTKYNGDYASPKADYDVAAKLVREGVTYTITWTVDNSKISVKESANAGFWTIDLPDVNDTEAKYVLTATITNPDGASVSVTFNRTLPVYSGEGIVTAPIAGEAYKLYFDQVKAGKVLFALATTQDNGNKFINATIDPKAAPDFYVEKVDGGFKIYTTVNGAKNYVYAKTTTNDEGHVSKYLGFSTTEGSVFYYKDEVTTWFTKIDNAEYGVGTYNTYETLSLSEASRFTADSVGSTQFVMSFMTKAYAESLTPTEAPTLTTPEQILNAAYALEANKGLGKYTLTGVITSVDTAYDSGYNNVTVTIVVNNMTDKPIQCFRLKGTGADQIAVGDTITVTGNIINYTSFNDDGSVKASKVEFDAGCTLDSWTAAGGEVTPPAEDEEEGGNENSEPAADSTLSIVDAVALGTTYKSDDWSGHYTTNKYYVSGVITKVKNVEKGELVIADAEGNTLTVYGAFDATGATAYKDLATKPVVGDTVTVYGVIGAYGQTVQLSNGWFTAHTAHTCDYAAATCGKASACKICGATTGAALGHTEANAEGRCDRCGVSFNPTEQTVAIAASTGALASNSLSISWSGNNVTVVSEKDTSTTDIRTSDTNHYRCYAGSKLTISGKNEEKISKIVITATEAKHANVLAGSLVTAGVSAVADGSTVTITVDEGTVDAVVFSCTAQTRINNVVVYYE